MCIRDRKEIDYVIKRRNQQLAEICLELSQAIGLKDVEKAREFVKKARRIYEELEDNVEKEVEIISELLSSLRNQ